MIWMMIIMFLPVLGLGLFLILPLWSALPLYLILFAISGSCHWLMMRSMQLPPQLGHEKMIGSVATVLNWTGDRGQVIWNGEIWREVARHGAAVASGDKVVIEGLSGLTAFVKPIKHRPLVSRYGQLCRRAQTTRDAKEPRYLQ